MCVRVGGSLLEAQFCSEECSTVYCVGSAVQLEKESAGPSGKRKCVSRSPKMHRFSAGALFNQSTTPAVPANAVYLSGQLPASSVLHIALNHLKSFRPPAIDFSLQSNQDSLYDDAGNTEAELPQKDARKAHVLLLTPDRATLANALAEERDTSLTARGSNSALHKLLDRIEIKSVHRSEFGCTFAN